MYDEVLANRVRALLSAREIFSERKMFGGLCFMLGGNMACGIAGDDLMVRTGPARYEESLRQPHARPMDFTGRPMTGMVFVGPEGLDDEGLARWLAVGVNFAATLPPKAGAAAMRKTPGASRRR